MDDPSFKLGGEPRPLKNESALADERVVTSDVSIDESATGRYSAGSLSGSDKFGHAYHRVLLGADLIALFVSSALTFLCVAAIGRGIDATDWALLILAVAPVWVLIAYQLGLYSQVERQIDFEYAAEIMPMIFASTVWSWFLVLARSLVTVGDTDLKFDLIVVAVDALDSLTVGHAVPGGEADALARCKAERERIGRTLGRRELR